MLNRVLDKLRLTPHRKTRPVNDAACLNFIIMGGQRCGTSSMVNHLSTHPDIGFIWDDDLKHEGEAVGWPFASPVLAHYQKGYDTGVYRSMASRHQGTKKIIATRQPYFMPYPHVAFGLKEQLPNVKLLFSLRNQPDAIYSIYRLSKSQGRMRNVDSFEQLIKWDPEGDAKKHGRNYALPESRNQWYREYWEKMVNDPDETPFILDRSFYYEQLVRYFYLFPPEQLMVISFEEFTRDPNAVFKRICAWLEIDEKHKFKKPKKVYGAAPEFPEMNPDVREAIKSFYRESNKRLFELLDWPADMWG